MQLIILGTKQKNSTTATIIFALAKNITLVQSKQDDSLIVRTKASFPGIKSPGILLNFYLIGFSVNLNSYFADC